MNKYNLSLHFNTICIIGFNVPCDAIAVPATTQLDYQRNKLTSIIIYYY